MKQTATLALVAALTLGAGTALAADKMDGMDMKGMDMGKKMGDMKAAPGAAHKAVGIVKAIDAAAGTVSVAHEPVKSLEWPAMVMGFAVKDKALLDKLAVGKKIEFEFVKEGKGYTLTSAK
ncbi:copper-binding protein [Aromatoleum toluvorans]|uniref:Copper-binding protein n=1 Tax=Aromatoleum toluvorans TaxID=92002 RepID=A0ABX1Q4P6_9RHOO|nr:copper-binding protein [Aromatoleum toluvorans]NMG45485.1 copper-binding protein [Aromatoleum toluvorans]